MNNDSPEDQKPANTAAVPTKDSDSGIALDDMGIPILEEIVAPKANHKPDAKTDVKVSSEALKRNLSYPNNMILVKALKNQLRSKVKNDLDDIAQDVAAKVVSGITQELEQKIRTQLSEILDHNLDEMINKAIADLPNRK